MLTISSVIESKLKSNPFLLDSLQKNLLNITELARLWHSEVQAKTKKQVTVEAISMTIRRFSSSIRSPQVSTHPQIQPLHTTIRTNLIERTYAKSPNIIKAYKFLTDTIDHHSDSFITMSMGIHEITIIADQTLAHLINNAFKSEVQTTAIDQLSAIILKLPDIVINTPGSYYNFLGKLAWHGLNIEEVVSTAHELIIIVKDDIAHQALQVLSQHAS